ncbi:MAG: TetR/AcrR family transcriptional regulator [Myxococcota bacterium]
MTMSTTSEAGLRDTKKRRTRSGIIANAVALFEAQGIRATRTSEMARVAEVSPGTLFNYFPTKDALVEAWLRGELDQIVSSAVTSHGDRGLRPLVRQICKSLAGEAMAFPALRAEGWGMLGRDRSAVFQLDRDSPLVRIVRQEQSRERVRKDHGSEGLAEILLDGFEGGICSAVRENASLASPHSPTAISRALQVRMDLILDGFRKRNERVAMSQASGSQGAASKT